LILQLFSKLLFHVPSQPLCEPKFSSLSDLPGACYVL
jgi:hypothetical protein